MSPSLIPLSSLHLSPFHFYSVYTYLLIHQSPHFPLHSHSSSPFTPLYIPLATFSLLFTHPYLTSILFPPTSSSTSPSAIHISIIHPHHHLHIPPSIHIHISLHLPFPFPFPIPFLCPSAISSAPHRTSNLHHPATPSTRSTLPPHIYHLQPPTSTPLSPSPTFTSHPYPPPPPITIHVKTRKLDRPGEMTRPAFQKRRDWHDSRTIRKKERGASEGECQCRNENRFGTVL